MKLPGEQIKELRKAARNIQGKLDEMRQVSDMLSEAADTIEGLREIVVSQNGKGIWARKTFEPILYEREQIEALKTKWKANNGSVCDTCRRMTCEYRADDIATCGLPKTETNWERLFGTPERAARTLEDACFYCDGKLACEDCVLGKMRGFRDSENEVAEWLRGDA